MNPDYQAILDKFGPPYCDKISLEDEYYIITKTIDDVPSAIAVHRDRLNDEVYLDNVFQTMKNYVDRGNHRES